MKRTILGVTAQRRLLAPTNLAPNWFSMLTPVADLRLKAGKDRPVRFGHPWVFSGALQKVPADIEPGSVVRVYAAEGELLGIGYVNPRCQIAVRMLARLDATVDATFIRERVEAAVALRRRVVGADTTAYRLINGEGDRLPGLVVDHYDGVLVMQVLTAGAERMKALVIDALRAGCSPRGIYERSDGSVRRAEGLTECAGVLDGEVPEDLLVSENGLRFVVHPMGGQKTGLYLDQRENRSLLRALAAGRRVLDAFAYCGGFAISAGAGGAAHVVIVERSLPALDAARQNWSRNVASGPSTDFVQADVARYLRETVDSFDLLVLDPPALVKQRKDVARGARAYKDLHLWALRRAEPGALLLTFSCSQHVDRELFRKIVLGAAVDVRRELQLLQHLDAGPDHPVAVGHPEGAYLHGLLLRVA